MTHYRQLLLFYIMVLGLTGCPRDVHSPTGFRLPDGDAENGRRVFVYYQCHQCHTMAGEVFPVIDSTPPPYVQLGGPVTKVKTYGELVTGIINPSHELAKSYAAEHVTNNGESKMYIYNDYMTVKELTDLVMFLQPHYDVIVPEYPYRTYH